MEFSLCERAKERRGVNGDDSRQRQRCIRGSVEVVAARAQPAERDGLPEGKHHFGGFLTVRTTRTRLWPRVRWRGWAGVLFENSIVCLVVFVCFLVMPAFSRLGV